MDNVVQIEAVADAVGKIEEVDGQDIVQQVASRMNDLCIGEELLDQAYMQKIVRALVGDQ